MRTARNLELLLRERERERDFQAVMCGVYWLILSGQKEHGRDINISQSKRTTAGELSLSVIILHFRFRLPRVATSAGRVVVGGETSRVVALKRDRERGVTPQET